MVHPRRKFVIGRYDTPAALAAAIKSNTWTLDSGFQVGNILLLNDSFTEDSLQEYALFRLPAGEALKPGVLTALNQIESLTISWIDEAALANQYVGPALEGDDWLDSYGAYNILIGQIYDHTVSA